jgi:hypothetical protein
MLTNGNTEAQVAKKSRTARRVGVVLATVGLSFAAFAPMAHAHGGHDGDGPDDHGHHSLWLPIGDPTPTSPGNENCGEDGMDALHLHPLASGVVHYGVEPIAGGLDNSLGAPDGQGLEGAVHAINCTTVVPLEDTVDYVEPAIEGEAEHQVWLSYNFVSGVCDHEFVCSHVVFLP